VPAHAPSNRSVRSVRGLNAPLLALLKQAPPATAGTAPAGAVLGSGSPLQRLNTAPATGASWICGIRWGSS